MKLAGLSDEIPDLIWLKVTEIFFQDTKAYHSQRGSQRSFELRV